MMQRLLRNICPQEEQHVADVCCDPRDEAIQSPASLWVHAFRCWQGGALECYRLRARLACAQSLCVVVSGREGLVTMSRGSTCLWAGHGQQVRGPAARHHAASYYAACHHATRMSDMHLTFRLQSSHKMHVAINDGQFRRHARQRMQSSQDHRSHRGRIRRERQTRREPERSCMLRGAHPLSAARRAAQASAYNSEAQADFTVKTRSVVCE